ncbi:MAG: (deoxy)nucleoside triphosphate pyrophosphohydrolase [Flammeovirgaceae bacterium]
MITVTAAIIEQDDQVLLARRKAGQHLAGFWEFPGGKLHQGESPEACLQRELQEEFGVRTAIGAFVAESIYEYPTKTVKLLAYRVTLLEQHLSLHAHDAIKWVSPTALLAHQLAPADIPLVEAYLMQLQNKSIHP